MPNDNIFPNFVSGIFRVLMCSMELFERFVCKIQMTKKLEFITVQINESSFFKYDATCLVSILEWHVLVTSSKQ